MKTDLSLQRRPVWYSWSEAKRPANDSPEHLEGRHCLGFCTTLLDSMNRDDGDAVHSRHLSAQEISELWRQYLSNVHPLTKLFFDWDKSPLLQKAAENPQALSKAEQAFSFAVYFITVLSLSNTECEDILGDSRRAQLLDDFQSSVETALLAAGFTTTSDLLVLQAFLLYMVMVSTFLSYVSMLTSKARNAQSCKTCCLVFVDGHCRTDCPAPGFA